MERHRFPLLVGVGAFRRLAVPSSALLLASAAAFTLYLEGPDLPNGELWRKLGYLGPVLAVVLFVSPLALLFLAKTVWRLVRDAVQTRACDVELDAEGLRVHGGTAGGFVARWSELGPAAVTWGEHGLRVELAKGALVLPAPQDAQERASLQSFAETLLATVRARAMSTPAREPPRQFDCSGCGAPVPPGPEEEVHCGHCRTRLRLPSELVAKVRAWQAVAEERRRDERTLRALRRQPPGWLANVIAFGGGGGLLLAGLYTALLTAAFALVDGREAGMPRMHGVGPMWIGASLLLFALTTYLLASRRALRALTLGFGAVGPDRAGEPYRCHHCGGPLPEPGGDASMIECAYCGCTSVRAVDARLWAATFPAQAGKEPEEILAQVRRSRRRATVLAAVAMAFVGAGGAHAALAFAPPALDASDAVEVPFVNEKQRAGVPEPVEAGPGAQRLERVARYGETFVELLGGQRLDVVVRGGYPIGDGEVTVLRLGEEEPWLAIETSARSFARVGATIWTFTPEGVVAYEGGGSRVVARGDVLGDPFLVEIAPAGDAAAIVTTRASPEGHLRLRRVTEGDAPIEQQDGREVAVHPDGEQVAYTVWRDERHQLALLPRLDAREGTLLTRGEGSVACPRWSPDGSRLAFLSTTVRDSTQFMIRYGRRDLYVLDLPSMTLHRMTEGGQVEKACPAWFDTDLYVVAREQREPTEPFEATVIRVVPKR